MLKQLSTKLKVCICSTLNFNQAQMKSTDDTFFGLFLTNISTGSSFIYLNNNLISSSGRDHTPARRSAGQAETRQPQGLVVLSPLLATASLHWEDLGRHLLQRFPKIHIHFLPVSEPPR